MPTYDYECTGCANRFEVFQSMKDEAVADCPVCGTNAKRLISGGLGVIFKGAGFYSTDNKKSASTTESISHKNSENAPKTGENAKSAAVETNKTENKESGKTESKESPKSDTKISGQVA